MRAFLTGLLADGPFSGFQRSARKALNTPPRCCEKLTLVFRAAFRTLVHEARAVHEARRGAVCMSLLTTLDQTR
jgi:hypothetical protein